MVIIIVLLGWLVGALVNYLADILPVKRALTSPVCVACHHEQAWFEYLIWPQRCSHCGKKRSLRVWLVEIVFVAVSLWLWYAPPEEMPYLVGMVLMVYFGTVTVIDLEHRLILHPVSLAGAFLGLGFGLWRHGLTSTLLGGAAGFICMLLLYLLGGLFIRWLAKLRGLDTDEVALGFGDVTLSGVLGLMLGWPGIAAGLILAILLGGAVSLLYLLVTALLGRYRAFTPIPYGPFLIASAVALLFFKDIFVGLSSF